jgi:hypothetical protein
MPACSAETVSRPIGPFGASSATCGSLAVRSTSASIEIWMPGAIAAPRTRPRARRRRKSSPCRIRSRRAACRRDRARRWPRRSDRCRVPSGVRSYLDDALVRRAEEERIAAEVGQRRPRRARGRAAGPRSRSRSRAPTRRPAPRKSAGRATPYSSACGRGRRDAPRLVQVELLAGVFTVAKKPSLVSVLPTSIASSMLRRLRRARGSQQRVPQAARERRASKRARARARCVSPQEHELVLARPETGAVAATSLTTIASRCLLRSFSRAYSSWFSVSAAKPTRKPPRLRSPSAARMSGVRSSSSGDGPSNFFDLLLERVCADASRLPRRLRSRSRRRRSSSHGRSVHLLRAVTTCATRAPRGGATCVGPKMRSTSAPRASASRASSMPIVPVEAFERKRTGSIASRVGPAVISTRSPCRSRRARRGVERGDDVV